MRVMAFRNSGLWTLRPMRSKSAGGRAAMTTPRCRLPDVRRSSSRSCCLGRRSRLRHCSARLGHAVVRMTNAVVPEIALPLADGQAVSGLLCMPGAVRAGYVLAHGAGAGMTHPFMTAVAEQLAERGIATLRYQFPYMERGSRRPDPPAIAHAAVRGAVAEAARRLPGLPLFAGGKSFGGRMTSQAQAEVPLPDIGGGVV